LRWGSEPTSKVKKLKARQKKRNAKMTKDYDVQPVGEKGFCARNWIRNRNSRKGRMLNGQSRKREVSVKKCACHSIGEKNSEVTDGLETAQHTEGVLKE